MEDFMSRLKVKALSIISILAISASFYGVTSADSTTNTSTEVGSSGIPRNVFRTDHIEAQADVLNISTTTVETAHKDRDFKKLISESGMTVKVYHQKVKTELSNEFVGQGYSQDQVTIALQHRQIERLRHEHKK
jgi:hypothetical protein